MGKVDLDPFGSGAHHRPLGRLAEHRQNVIEQLDELGRLGRAHPLRQGGKLAGEDRHGEVGEVGLTVGARRGDLPQALPELAGTPLLAGGETGRDLGDPPIDVGLRADQDQRAPQRDHVAVANDPHLDVLAVDLRAVGALEIGEDDLVVVLLELEVVAANPFVVELDRVALLAADRDRRGEAFEHLATVGAVQDSEGDIRHRHSSGRPARSSWLSLPASSASLKIICAGPAKPEKAPTCPPTSLPRPRYDPPDRRHAPRARDRRDLPGRPSLLAGAGRRRHHPRRTVSAPGPRASRASQSSISASPSRVDWG